MKKLSLLIILFICVSVSTVAQDKNIKEIRQMYAEAMQKLTEMKEEPHYEKSLTVKKQYVVPAIGIVKETIEYFADDISNDEDPTHLEFSPFFIRVKTDAGPTMMSSNEEYLYYSDGTLAFCFRKSKNIYAEEAVNVESRTYFDTKGKLIHSSVKIISADTGKEIPIVDEFEADDKSIKAESKKYLKGFDAFMKQ